MGDVVYFVCLVSFVELLGQALQQNKPDKPNRPNKPERPDQPDKLRSG
jgi:hypothetical protein